MLSPPIWEAQENHHSEHGALVLLASSDVLCCWIRRDFLKSGLGFMKRSQYGRKG